MNEQTYRELLTLAAKAVKIEGDYEPKYFHGAGPNNHGIYIKDTGWVWNPIDDNGDALQLAVKLRIEVEHNHPSDSSLWVGVRIGGLPHHYAVEYFDAEDQRLKATRLAFVRAAAEIAKSDQIKS